MVSKEKRYKVFLMRGHRGMGFYYWTPFRKGTEGNAEAMRSMYSKLFKEPWSEDISVLELERA